MSIFKTGKHDNLNWLSSNMFKVATNKCFSYRDTRFYKGHRKCLGSSLLNHSSTLFFFYVPCPFRTWLSATFPTSNDWFIYILLCSCSAILSHTHVMWLLSVSLLPSIYPVSGRFSNLSFYIMCIRVFQLSFPFSRHYVFSLWTSQLQAFIFFYVSS